MKKAISVILWVVLVALLIAGVVMLYRYTNGFNEDFKTFYIERDGTKILTENSTATFEAGTEVHYGVGYTFDLPDSGTKEYSMKILPNPDADFDFTANGVTFAWRKVEGLETCFALDKQADGFTLKIPSYNSIADYLRELYEGQEIDLSGSFIEGLEGDIPFFLLRVASYNEAVTYEVAFSVLAHIGAYTITFSSVPGGNGWMTEVVCPTRANAGDTVSFSWEWSRESPYQELKDVVVKTESGSQVSWTWDADYRFRQFTMPAENVTILVTYGMPSHGGEEPETGYTITFSSVPGGNGWMTEVVCPARANAGDTVSFSWEWSRESPYQELKDVVVKTESGSQVSWTWDADYRFRQFTMPAENVTILVTYGMSAHGG